MSERDVSEIDVTALDGDLQALRDALIEEMRRLHLLTLRAFRDEVEALTEEFGSARSSESSSSSSAPPISDAVVDRIEQAFHSAAKPDQAQAATYLSRHMRIPVSEVKAALYTLVQAGKIYARPHMKSYLYYLRGFGPGPGR